MSNTYEENKKLILGDKLSSKWLKNAIKALDKGNAWDWGFEAKNDAEELFELMEQKADEEMIEWHESRKEIKRNQ
jgi:hypothetical protein